MPVQIGATTHNFSDPTGLLSDCHRRIEMFLGTLMAVAEVIDRPPTEDTARALESALRYFAQAAPKHTADEEESLFPRLRQIRHAEMQAAFSKLKELEEEHRCSPFARGNRTPGSKVSLYGQPNQSRSGRISQGGSGSRINVQPAHHS